MFHRMLQVSGTALAWATLCGSSQAASFERLGIAPGGTFSNANGVSYDGSVVVGTNANAISNPWRAFRWTQASGQQLILPPDGNASGASGVSADGSVVVGASTGAPGGQPYRWTAAGGMTFLGLNVNGTYGGATAVSADGSVVVGWGDYQFGRWNESFRWTQSTGLVPQGFVPPGDGYSYVELGAVSGDGVYMVGGSGNDFVPSEAFVDTANGPMVGIGRLPGGSNSFAVAANFDGSVVVGESESDIGTQAFRWTTAGMVGLGDLPGGSVASKANGVSYDGSIIVGRGTTDAGQLAFIWDAVNGMRDLQGLLTTEFGLDLTGWTLSTATAISGNGSVVIGNGINPDGRVEGFRASIPEPTAAMLVISLVGLSQHRRRGQARTRC